MAPTAAIISPYEATWAFAENAAENGWIFFFEREVQGLEKERIFFISKRVREIFKLALS